MNCYISGALATRSEHGHQRLPWLPLTWPFLLPPTPSQATFSWDVAKKIAGESFAATTKKDIVWLHERDLMGASIRENNLKIRSWYVYLWLPH